MSANHQSMSAREYLEKVEELQRLKHGDGEALRKAEEEARKALDRMKKDTARVMKGISQQRRRLLTNLTNIENAAVQTLGNVAASVEQTQQQLGQLQTSIKEASQGIDALIASTNATYVTAAELYQQAKAELTACQLDVDYMRFAANELLSIDQRIRQLQGQDLSGAVMQAAVQMIMADIYYMDILVSSKRVAFIRDQAEALRTAEELLAKAKNVRENNHEELDNAESPLMDMDFWTDGCFGELEEEVRTILQRVRLGQTDANYSQDQLTKDLNRLRELERIQDMLVATARAKINLSYYRREQGDLIESILENDHRYSIISKGFAKGGDAREAFILRMRRHTDGAQIEVIINPGEKDGEADVYFRVDSSTYMDSKTMASITQAIAEELQENGVDMRQYRACNPEQMPQFQPGDTLEISNEARRYHSIPQRQPMTMPTPTARS